jgi:beta-xylosidase
MRIFFIKSWFLLLGALYCCQLTTQAWQSDNGDGTFTNPPLYADFPDPDIIRVGEDFYFATTTFANSPGVTILHSKDLVNWEYISHVVSRLDGSPKFDLENGGSYRNGFFAASLRHYKGTFYVVVTPVGLNTRVYYSKDVRGPWQYHLLDRAAFDPGFFIEDDGTGYIATSGGWDGHVTLLKLNEDFSRVVDAKPMFYYRGIEGSHVVKRHGWYYVFNALPGKLAFTCSRSTNLFGPYETIEQMSDRTGGHQGAIVDLPDGSDYGFLMKDSGPAGRMTFISPIFWTNNWPVWGTPEAPGKIPATAKKTIQGQPVMQPATSDEFDSPTLGLQWQWNHNPDDSRWSLTEHPGFLRLKPTQADEFWLARNTLTQKGQGPWSRGTVKLDLNHLKPGDVCGFGTLGKFNGQIAVMCGEDGKLSLRMSVIEDNAREGRKTDERVAFQPLDATEIYLRTDLDFKAGMAGCAYSLDGKTWAPLGGEFKAAYDWRTGTFQGLQFAIFCYNPNSGEGFVDVDWFHFTDKQNDQ